jgi:glyceraldehyde 3-phosphate dehydrogenase
VCPEEAVAIRIGINGLGRIGRGFLRDAIATDDLEVVAVNDVGDPEILAHLIRNDSLAGRFDREVRAADGRLVVDGRAIRCTCFPSPARIPWGGAGADLVIEATGCFTARAAAAGHFEGGARAVVITSPSTDADITLCYGINHEAYKPEVHRVISAGSCTTHAVTGILTVIDEAFGIEHAAITTVHCVTNNQVLVDAPHADRRRARAAGLSMIPTSTTATLAVGQVIPRLAGRLHCLAVRVPTAAVSLVDLTVTTARPVTVETARAALRDAAAGRLAGILGYSDEELVSIDYLGDRRSAVVDGPLIAVEADRFVKVLAWYDNERGYVTRLADLARHLAGRAVRGRNPS